MGGVLQTDARDFSGAKELRLLRLYAVKEALQFRTELTQNVDARIESNLSVPHLNALHSRHVLRRIPSGDKHCSAVITDQSRQVRMKMAARVVGNKRHLQSVPGAMPHAAATAVVVARVESKQGIAALVNSLFDDE